MKLGSYMDSKSSSRALLLDNDLEVVISSIAVFIISQLLSYWVKFLVGSVVVPSFRILIATAYMRGYHRLSKFKF